MKQYLQFPIGIEKFSIVEKKKWRDGGGGFYKLS